MVINRTSLDDWRLKYLADENIPHVSLERPSALSQTYCVETDCQQGYSELVSTLKKNGFDNFVYIGGPTNLKINQDRYAWIENAMSREGKMLDSNHLFQSDLSREGGYNSTRQVLRQINPPLALICINDLTAIGAMHACLETGMKIGQNVAICGYDGIPEVAYSHPPLTTFEQPVYDIARILTRMLISLINKEVPKEMTHKIFPKVVFRASTGNMKV